VSRRNYDKMNVIPLHCRPFIFSRSLVVVVDLDCGDSCTLDVDG